jgi:sigma-B regulation protein RsbU (phosphoserine phosphatase)
MNAMAENPSDCDVVDLAALEQVDECAEDLYDNAPCGYFSALPDGTIVKVNQTLLTWTGYTRNELIGRRRFSELLSAGGRIFYETHYSPLLRMQGTVKEIALDLVCADGRVMPVLVNSVLKQDGTDVPCVIRTTVFEATDRRRYERELLAARQRAEQAEARARLLAQTLQDSLIPPAPPRIPGLDIAAVYRPAGRGDEVGGDFYDVFETARGDWAVILGDVCGKGAQAAGITALARYTARATAMRTRRPGLVLASLNEALVRQNTARFCTVVYARLRIGLRGGPVRLTISSGGHPLPVRLSKAEPPTPVGTPGPLLGVLDAVDLPETTVELVPGDVVVFHTDGVTEGRRGREFFGDGRLDRLLSSWRDRDADTIASRIVEEVLAFQSGHPRDDIALVVVKVPDGES